MKSKNIDSEHFSFSYNHFRFDVIFSIHDNKYELLVGIHSVNFAFILEIDSQYTTSLDEQTFFHLCKILNLKPSKESFTSFIFLKLLSDKMPFVSSGNQASYKNIIPFRHLKKIDESEKIYFRGWNDHKLDHKKARNFEKTEFYFGKNVANYCKKNNISSIWSSTPNDASKYYNPWENN